MAVKVGEAVRIHEPKVLRLVHRPPAAAANALQAAKRIFSHILRGVVAEYAMTADEVDEVVGVLLKALGGR